MTIEDVKDAIRANYAEYYQLLGIEDIDGFMSDLEIEFKDFEWAVQAAKAFK